jgi:hypothetical protein
VPLALPVLVFCYTARHGDTTTPSKTGEALSRSRASPRAYVFMLSSQTSIDQCPVARNAGSVRRFGVCRGEICAERFCVHARTFSFACTPRKCRVQREPFARADQAAFLQMDQGNPDPKQLAAIGRMDGSRKPGQALYSFLAGRTGLRPQPVHSPIRSVVD